MKLRKTTDLQQFRRAVDFLMHFRVKFPSSNGNVKLVEVGDMNGDGVPDLVLSTNNDGTLKVALWWIDGADLVDGKILKIKSISDVHGAKYDKVELIDIDQDGDLDVLICEENHGEGSKGLGDV